VEKEDRRAISSLNRLAETLSASGSGLGTYIARLICELHGGSIGFTTDPQEGTRLRIELPRTPQAGHLRE
jgi:signal transduction histidine kinase